MKITVIPAGRLSTEHLEAWEQFQQATPALDSPFFRPEYTQEVAAVCDGVEVAVLEEGGELVGFFPYQRGRGGVAGPVGSDLCDFHGLVLRPGTACDVRELLRGCGLAAWHFHAVPAKQDAFQPFHWVRFNAPYLDLRAGFEAYDRDCNLTGSTIAAKARKAAKQIGPIRLEPHTCSDEIFRQLLAWKIAQYRRTKAPNALGQPWRVALLERLRRREDKDFQGVLSTMYFGDRLAAIHFGIRCGNVLHMWFPTYDPTLAKYSPGLIFFMQVAKVAEGLGIRRFDLGRGTESYKARFQSGATVVGEGAIDRRPLTRWLQHNWVCAREWMRAHPSTTPARLVVRTVRGWLSR